MPIEDGACIGLPGRNIIRINLTEDEMLKLGNRKASILTVEGLTVFRVLDENLQATNNYSIFVIVE